MDINKNDIVTVSTVAGEFVGKLNAREGTKISLDDPRFVSVTEQGMGFANGIAMTSESAPKYVEFENYIFVTKTNDSVANAYRQAVSGLTIPQKSGIIL